MTITKEELKQIGFKHRENGPPTSWIMEIGDNTGANGRAIFDTVLNELRIEVTLQNITQVHEIIYRVDDEMQNP